MGLQGERDIHKKVLEIRIPNFDKRQSDHIRLAELSSTAHSEVQTTICNIINLPKSLAKKREIARKTIADIQKKIDVLVSKIIFS